MLIPSNYEKLNQNVLVVGASVIRLLRKKRYTVEDLFQEMRRGEQINIDRFYSVLSFLWISDIIDSDDFHLFIKK